MFFGNTRDRLLDRADPELALTPVVLQFGKYMKVVIARHEHSEECGSSDCSICKAPRLPEEVFEQLQPLPDPTPGTDNHYIPFDEIIGKPTSEEHRPSLLKAV